MEVWLVTKAHLEYLLTHPKPLPPPKVKIVKQD